LNGFWDYGPLGTALKNNIRDHWWRCMVDCPPIGPDGEPVSIVGLDSAIIQNPKTWEASGHVGGFSDPMVDDKETKQRFRADHLVGFWILPDENEISNDLIKQLADVTLLPTATFIDGSTFEITERLKSDTKLKKSLKLKSVEEYVEPHNLSGTEVHIVHIDRGNGIESGCIGPVSFSVLEKFPEKVVSPFTGKPGALTSPREFNLMFMTYVGALATEDSKTYLRPETAQGIFLNYKNVVDTMRVKMPFGIAQIGKSFRNEVTPRNFIFRSREFEQMEMEWFCAPDEALDWYEFWKQERMRWWKTLGIEESNLIFRDHDEDELAHYSNACVDVEYKYPFTAPGYGELEGVAHRGCFDLTQHQEHSRTKMEYFDQPRQLKAKEEGKSKEEVDAVSKYIPNVIEPASGLTRAVLVLLCEAYTPDPGRAAGVFMKFKPKFAPVKAGVFPLVNKDGMPEKAMSLYLQLREKFACEYDAKQSIGKRYARMDEIGTPYCFTVDGETAADDSVTVRHRDTQEQERVNLG
ncbi:MAG: glycine--tRNA ligase, partial [Planctomycetota bacterium]